ncbi:MAG: response regulator [Steroidobacteraceae bacterium]
MASSRIRVFIADDHALVRDGIVAILHTAPDIEIVGTAANGRLALEQIVALCPDVAILDLSMPELDGISLTRQILTARPKTAIVILSMHSSAQHVFQALEAGARSYLLKESAGREIAETVRAVHLGRRHLGARIAEIVAEGLSNRRNTSPLESLSNREREILKLVADGLSSAEIGRRLSLSPKTVDTYRSRLMQKLQITDLAGLIKFAILHGLTPLQ